MLLLSHNSKNQSDAFLKIALILGSKLEKGKYIKMMIVSSFLPPGLERVCRVRAEWAMLDAPQ